MYNNNTNTNQSIYESQLFIVSTLIEEFKYKKEEILIAGDFNGDILRNGNIKTLILAYCDDLILLSTSLKKIWKPCWKCVEYSLNWIFKFNSNKSLIMNCGFKIYENDQIKIKIGCKYWKLKILVNIWGY